ncbi:hypothetical protein B0F90DRAFT_1698132 [Multifurca ochricompacta]|uniref:Uncharacterized protein n=1 Tax=Multifurca ochricompacta TaxID=376703 RepID=A0AAD4MAE8_9AGAM|nr:hypothetical protein B0F90DRAFT_1698132 [Multifurca ochricompacta]
MTAINVETRYFPSSRASLPALALQVTCLSDSYMLWIGVTDNSEENAGRATLQGHLGKDWVVAMPPWKTLPGTGTQLLRSSSSDVALSIATRLARRFGKQIFLSVDVPTSIGDDCGILVDVEKGLVETLKEIEGKSKSKSDTL